MDIGYFRTQFEYVVWARGRVCEQVSLLSADEYAKPRLPNGGSIRSTLVHALAADEYWLARLSGDSAWTTMLTEQDVPSFEDVQGRWSGLDTKMSAYLAGISNVDVEAQLTYASARSPREFTNPVWALLTQRTTHCLQHLTEVALALAQMGYSTGDLDFILYLGLARTQPGGSS